MKYAAVGLVPIVTNIAIIKLKYVTEYNTIQYNTTIVRADKSNGASIFKIIRIFSRHRRAKFN